MVVLFSLVVLWTSLHIASTAPGLGHCAATEAEVSVSGIPSSSAHRLLFGEQKTRENSHVRPCLPLKHVTHFCKSMWMMLASLRASIRISGMI